MNSAEVLALYAWASGTCFRHPQSGEVPTTHLVTLHPRTGEGLDIRGCSDCVLMLEHQRERAAKRSGGHYEPGQLGQRD